MNTNTLLSTDVMVRLWKKPQIILNVSVQTFVMERYGRKVNSQGYTFKHLYRNVLTL